MSTRDRALLILAVVTLVGTVGSVQAADTGKDVVVTNTPDQPVPVALQGTPTVNIGNTPSVTVSGTPTVGLDPAANQVQVANDDPIAVDTGGQPFQAGSPSAIGIVLPAGDPLFSTTFDVPAGAYLRIDHVGGLVVTDPADSPTIQVQASFQGLITQKYILAAGGSDRMPFGEDLTMFAGPGTSVGITVQRQVTTSDGLFRWAASGYLFDA